MSVNSNQNYFPLFFDQTKPYNNATSWMKNLDKCCLKKVSRIKIITKESSSSQKYIFVSVDFVLGKLFQGAWLSKSNKNFFI